MQYRFHSASENDPAVPVNRISRLAG